MLLNKIKNLKSRIEMTKPYELAAMLQGEVFITIPFVFICGLAATILLFEKINEIGIFNYFLLMIFFSVLLSAKIIKFYFITEALKKKCSNELK